MASTPRTTYLDPGSYINEVVVPTGFNIPALPFAPCYIGVGSRFKRVTNEAVTRGLVQDEELTLSGSSPYIATLTNRADKRLENTTVTRTLNGISSVVADDYISFNPAQITGSVTGTVNLTTNNAIGLKMDGLDATTIVIRDVAAGVTPTNVVITNSGGVTSISAPSATFLTAGVRPGHTVTVSLAEDGANDGPFTVLSVTETTLTYEDASGTANPDDDTITFAFSGTGRYGRELHTFYNIGTVATTSMSEIAAAINQALSSDVAEGLGFSSDYSDCASVVSSALRITSQTDYAPSSDVEVMAAPANSATAAIFGSASLSADSVLVLADQAYNASATYTVNYVQVDSDQDTLAEEDVQTIVSVGSRRGGTNFTEVTDWSLASDQVDWDQDTAATITGLSGTFDLDTTPDDLLTLRIDGKLGDTSETVNIEIDLVGLVPAPLGYTAPVSSSAVTVNEVVVNINAVLAMELGPEYRSVASNVGGFLTLTSPIKGRASSEIEVVAGDDGDAHTLLFGGETSANGTGKRPTDGATYYVTYEYTRPESDYNVPFRHFSREEAFAQVGLPSVSVSEYNPLAIMADIGFENGPQFIYTIQVKDTLEGAPTRSEVLESLEGAKTSGLTTEIILVGEIAERYNAVIDAIDHIEDQNSSTEKHPRRFWSSRPSNTEIGDKDTEDSYVYHASRVLQVAATSPARGRMFSVVPPQEAGLTRDVTLDDGTVTRIALNGSYLAGAVAARRCSLPGPAETLTGRTIVGFNTDDITNPWKPQERRLLAGAGNLVVSYDAGRLIIKDAVTTEGGGGNLNAFKIDSTSYQKDIITTKVNQALEANIVGIVPFDLATFILDIKLVIAGVLAKESSATVGTIGPYRDSDGNIRELDLLTDIRVQQDPDDQTTYNFFYFYNLRYPALRLFGQYSVDSSRVFGG